MMRALLHEERIARLDRAYRYAKTFILSHQSATTGLFLSRLSLSQEELEAQPKEAWVDNNVMTVVVVWALAMGYRKVDDDQGRRYELEQSAVKCVRGLLNCMMREADRVEELKKSQSIHDALHNKYNLDHYTAINDAESRRLSISALSLFIYYLAQMIQTGLQIVFTMDEVCFVQNLVYCIERAYRTPDFSVWEKDNQSKLLDTRPDLHASSIGMAKAALEAIDGVNILGPRFQSSGGFIHVDSDALNRNRAIFRSLLPRESNSKETDVLLLTVTGFPAFACDSPSLVAETEAKVMHTLMGRCGFRRFQGDTREEGIGCEYPVFLAITAITEYIHAGPLASANKAKGQLESLLVDMGDGTKLLPELYYPTHSKLRRHSSHTSQQSEGAYRPRTLSQCSTHMHTTGMGAFGQSIASDSSLPATPLKVSEDKSQFTYHTGPMQHNNKFLLWHQALYLLTTMLGEGIVDVKDLDPMERRFRPIDRSGLRVKALKSSGNGAVRRERQKTDIVVQVALLAENEKLQTVLGTYGILTQTPKQIEPITIKPPSTLVDLYSHLGVNRNFNLSGRPNRPCGSLATSKAYMLRAQTFVFFPLVLQHTDFYMSLDLLLLIDKIKDELKFIQSNWTVDGRPLFCLLITEIMVSGGNFPELLDLMASLKQGEVQGVRIKLGRLQQLISTSCMEHIEFLSAQAYDEIFHSDTVSDQEYLPRLMTDRRESQHEKDLVCDRTQSLDKDTMPHYTEVEELVAVETQAWASKPIGEIVEMLKGSNDLLQQSAIVAYLAKTVGLDYDTQIGTVDSLLDEIYESAGGVKLWSVIRQVSGVKRKVTDSLAPALAEILIRDMQVSIGTYGSPQFVISAPLTPMQLANAIFDYVTDPREAVLNQELLLYLSHFVMSAYGLFDSILRLRVGAVVEAMKSELAIQFNLRSKVAATAKLMSLRPYAVKCLLRAVLNIQHDCACASTQPQLFPPAKENLDSAERVTHSLSCPELNGQCLRYRFLDGLLMRFNTSLYAKIWDILQKCHGLCMDGRVLRGDPSTSGNTEDIRAFMTQAEEWLFSIKRPEMRATIADGLTVLWVVLAQRMPELKFPQVIHVHQLVNQAAYYYRQSMTHKQSQPINSEDDPPPPLDVIRQAYLFGDEKPEEFKSQSQCGHDTQPIVGPWQLVRFCSLPRKGTGSMTIAFTKAIVNLIQTTVEVDAVCAVQ